MATYLTICGTVTEPGWESVFDAALDVVEYNGGEGLNLEDIPYYFKSDEDYDLYVEAVIRSVLDAADEGTLELDYDNIQYEEVPIYDGRAVKYKFCVTTNIDLEQIFEELFKV